MWKALSVNNTIMPTHRAGCRAQNQINFGSRYPYTKNGGRTYPRIRSSNAYLFADSLNATRVQWTTS